MADSFTNLIFHIVFAVKYRDAMIDGSWREELYKYMSGIIKSDKHVPIIIGGYFDHVHILLSADKHLDLPTLIKKIKLASNQWIQPKCRCKFQWQSGYACFTVSNTHVKQVSEYIKNQIEHHKKTPMLDEFRQLFGVNGMQIKDDYFFKYPE